MARARVAPADDLSWADREISSINGLTRPPEGTQCGQVPARLSSFSLLPDELLHCILARVSSSPTPPRMLDSRPPAQSTNSALPGEVRDEAGIHLAAGPEAQAGETNASTADSAGRATPGHPGGLGPLGYGPHGGRAQEATDETGQWQMQASRGGALEAGQRLGAVEPLSAPHPPGEMSGGPLRWGGGYWHALVCRRWRDLSKGSLRWACVKGPRAPLLGSDALGEKLLELSALEHVAVSASAVRPPTAPLLRALVPAGAPSHRTAAHPPSPGLPLLQSLRSDCLFEALPDGIGRLQGLRVLSLATSAETLPESLCHLSSLTCLTLSCPNLRSFPQLLGCLSQLRRLHLSTGPMLSSLPPSIGSLGRLRSLCLKSQSPGLQDLPDSLGELRKLRALEVRCPGLLSMLPESSGGMASLRRLHIHSCPMLISFPESFTFLWRLSELRLTRTRLTQDVLGYVAALPFKVGVEMRECRVLDLNRGGGTAAIPRLAMNRHFIGQGSYFIGAGVAVVCLLALAGAGALTIHV